MKRSGRVDMPIGLRTLTVREEALGWRVATGVARPERCTANARRPGRRRPPAYASGL